LADGMMSRAMARAGLVFAGLVLAVIVGEVTARIYYRVAHRVPAFRSTHVRAEEPTFGWDGRRVFGDPTTTRSKLLVLGDSMTYGKEIPTLDLYCARLGALLDVEVFAYGGPGYGTLQELLVLERYLPLVRPDMILLQVSSNDFINNSWPLERASFHNANMMARPYLMGDSIRMRFPSRLEILSPTIEYSRLGRLLVMEGARLGTELNRRGWLRSAEDEIAARGLGDEPFRLAVTITEAIIAKMVARLGPIPLVAFAADDSRPYLDQWRQVLQRQHVPFVEDVPARIVAEERISGMTLRPDGAHWNARGHRIVAEALAKALGDGVALVIAQKRQAARDAPDR
jgi:lysophospholipase L1-like esterase